jgi:hypothetical protein
VPFLTAAFAFAVIVLALTGVFAPVPVQALEPGPLEPGPEGSSGRQLAFNPTGQPTYMELLSVTPDYVAYAAPGQTNPYEAGSRQSA